MIRFWTLGRVDLEKVEADAARSVLRAPKRLAVLSYLTLARPRGYQRRDTLLALFWPDSDAERGRHALRNTLYELRQALGAAALPGRGQDEVGVAGGELWCDAVAFREALDAGEDARALELYGGELLPGLHVEGASRPFEDWLEGERERTRREAGEAADRLVEAAADAGRVEEGVRWARRAVDLAPYDEARLRRLMELLARAGNRGAAIRAYDGFVERAASDLGLRPGAETRSLAASIRSPSGGDEDGAAPTSAAPDGEPGVGSERKRPAGAESASGPEGGQPSPSPEVPGWRTASAATAAVLGLVGLAAVLGGDGPEAGAEAGAGGGDRGAAAGQRVAVFPFTVREDDGAETAFLGGGLATLLAADLDGAGGFRTVDPRALQGRGSSEGAQPGGGEGVSEVAERLGADLYVLGDAVSASGRIHLSAALYRPSAASVRARASVEGERDSLFRLVDRLAARLLAERYPERELPLVRQAARTTASLEALKAYLAGEERFRAGRFASAVSAYQEAVQADSAFALAHHRLSVTAEWVGNRTLARQAAERAVRRASRLPERERRLLSAHLTSLRGDARAAERQYREILATYPTDLEAWYQLGEILFHYGPAVGRSVGEARSAFEEVRSLSAGHVPSLVHLARIAAAEGRSGDVSRLAGRVLALVPGSAHAWEMKALDAYAGDATDRARRDLVTGLRDAADRSVRLAVWNVAVFAEEPGAAGRLAELLSAPWRSPGARRLGREWRAELALARGRWGDARAALSGGPDAEGAFHSHRDAFLAALPFVAVEDSTLRVLRERLERTGEETGRSAGSRPDGDDAPVADSAGLRVLRRRLRLFSSALLCSRAGDYGAALARAEELEAPPGTERAVPLVERLGRIVRAHVAWRRGEPRRGLEILGRESVETRSSLMYGLDYVQPFERYLRARLLEDAGRGREAIRWLASYRHQHVHHLVYLAPSHLRRARILEAEGDAAAARRHYRAFLELWQDPDPELRPVRREAARRLERLAAAAGAP